MNALQLRSRLLGMRRIEAVAALTLSLMVSLLWGVTAAPAQAISLSPEGRALLPEPPSRIFVAADGTSYSTLPTEIAIAIEPMDVRDPVGSRVLLPGSAEPFDIAVTPDGSTAYVSRLENDVNPMGSVERVDLTTGESTPIADVGLLPTEIELTPDGTTLLVGLEGASELVIVSTATNEVRARVALRTKPYALAVDDDAAYVGGYGVVHRVDIVTAQVVATSDSFAGVATSMTVVQGRVVAAVRDGLLPWTTEVAKDMNGYRASAYTGTYYDERFEQYRLCVFQREGGGSYSTVYRGFSGAYQFGTGYNSSSRLAERIRTELVESYGSAAALEVDKLTVTPLHEWNRYFQDAAFWTTFDRGAGWRQWSSEWGANWHCDHLPNAETGWPSPDRYNYSPAISAALMHPRLLALDPRSLTFVDSIELETFDSDLSSQFEIASSGSRVYATWGMDLVFGGTNYSTAVIPMSTRGFGAPTALTSSPDIVTALATDSNGRWLVIGGDLSRVGDIGLFGYATGDAVAPTVSATARIAKGILRITGVSTRIEAASEVTVHVRSGKRFVAQKKTTTVQADGTFTWRQAFRGKSARVYVVVDGVRSATVKATR